MNRCMGIVDAARSVKIVDYNGEMDPKKYRPTIIMNNIDDDLKEYANRAGVKLYNKSDVPEMALATGLAAGAGMMGSNNNNINNISRRQFLKKGGMAAAGALLYKYAKAYDKVVLSFDGGDAYYNYRMEVDANAPDINLDDVYMIGRFSDSKEIDKTTGKPLDGIKHLIYMNCDARITNCGTTGTIRCRDEDMPVKVFIPDGPALYKETTRSILDEWGKPFGKKMFEEVNIDPTYGLQAGSWNYDLEKYPMRGIRFEWRTPPVQTAYWPLETTKCPKMANTKGVILMFDDFNLTKPNHLAIFKKVALHELGHALVFGNRVDGKDSPYASHIMCSSTGANVPTPFEQECLRVLYFVPVAHDMTKYS